MLYFDTVIPLLRSTLETLMESDIFSEFRLVGGTALSLQLGHRMSDDIDLFTDGLYGSIDFEKIDAFFRDIFPCVDCSDSIIIGMGKSYSVGVDKKSLVKVDLFYTDEFIRKAVEIDEIRMADIDDIVAMKIEVIQRGGRKKDFWDLHELLDKYSLEEMIALHEERYPYGHDADLIISNFKNFEKADDQFDPICLKGKYWEVIKSDMTEMSNNYSHSK
jgi:hypothetical protein